MQMEWNGTLVQTQVRMPRVQMRPPAMPECTAESTRWMYLAEHEEDARRDARMTGG